MSDIASVKVAVRIRPLVSNEISRGCKEIVDVVEENEQVIIRSTDKDKPFTFNYVLPSHSPQDELYTRCVQPLIGNLFKGYNVTILAYGQTGSGKTHSMGTTYKGEGEMGVIPRATAEIFDFVRDNFTYDFTISVSFMELYQEVLYDLLSSKNRDQCTLDIREDIVRGIHIPGLTEVPVQSTAEVLDALARGSLGRVTGSTTMNSQSSRSHAIFIVNISMNSKENCKQNNKQAKLHLVDLAGSQRSKKTGAIGNTFNEDVYINIGLLALDHVIGSLGNEKAQYEFIPFQDSKLTRLLKDSLGGNSITLMIACVSPADYNVHETLSTLRYADRVRKIKNKPVVNQGAKVAEINELKKTIQHLRLQIVGQGGPMICPAEIELLKKQIADLKLINHDLTVQLSAALADKTVLQNAIEAQNKEISELNDQYDITSPNKSTGLENNDTDLLRENLAKLQQIQSPFVAINSEQKKTENEIRHHEETLNKHLMSSPTTELITKQMADLKLINHDLTVQLSAALADKTVLQNAIEAQNKEISELNDQYDITSPNKSTGLENNDTDLLRENLAKLQQIQSPFVAINSEQKKTENEIRHHEETLNKHLMSSLTTEEETPAEIREQQETHTTRQVALNTELLEIQKQLVLKENLPQRLATNNQYMVDYQALAENKAKIKVMEKEKQELLQQLKNAQTHGGSSKQLEQRCKRVQELEAQLHDLTKKIQEQARLVSIPSLKINDGTFILEEKENVQLDNSLIDEVVSDNVENDLDWWDTRLRNRIEDEMEKLEIISQKYNFNEKGALKRSSDGGCTCKTNCQESGCGCKKLKVQCSNSCKCIAGVCENRDKENVQLDNSLIDEVVSDNVENDIDWWDTQLRNRIEEELKKLDLLSQKYNFNEKGALKRSSDGGCTCKTNCQESGCGCKKLKVQCSNSCKCIAGVCENRDKIF